MKSSNINFKVPSLRRAVSKHLAKRALYIKLGQQASYATSLKSYHLPPQSHLSSEISSLLGCFERHAASAWVSSSLYFDNYLEPLPGDSFSDSRLFLFEGHKLWIEELGIAYPFYYPFAWKVEIDLSCANLLKLYIDIKNQQYKGRVLVWNDLRVVACKEETSLLILLEEVVPRTAQASGQSTIPK